MLDNFHDVDHLIVMTIDHDNITRCNRPLHDDIDVFQPRGVCFFIN